MGCDRVLATKQSLLHLSRERAISDVGRVTLPPVVRLLWRWAMGASTVGVVGAALTLAATMSVVPLQVAGAQSPTTSVLVPSSGATVSGTGVVLDASASAGVTRVQFELTGGSLSDSVIATATVTQDG